MTAAETAYRTNQDAVELRNELVLSELSQVYYCARRIHERLPQHVELEDLVQAGVLGLIDAATRFDKTKDVKFPTFATFRIKGAILDSLRKADWGSRKLRSKGRAINAAAAQIGSESGRQAMHEEIAGVLGVTSQELHDTMTQINALSIVGQMTASSDDSDTMQDLIESAPDRSENSPFALCLRSENRALLITALEKLSERERYVIQLYYEKELTLREIAPILSLTVSRISQIHKNAISKLRVAIAAPPSSRPATRTSPAAQPAHSNAAPVMRFA